MSKYITVRLNFTIHVQNFSFKNDCINIGIVLPYVVKLTKMKYKLFITYKLQTCSPGRFMAGK